MIGRRSAAWWKACPHAKAVPGVRVAYTDEREIQHAMDLGALVIVIPDRPLPLKRGKSGKGLDHVSARWASVVRGGGQAFEPEMCESGGNVPGGYRNTINKNVVLIEMIETIEGRSE